MSILEKYPLEPLWAAGQCQLATQYYNTDTIGSYFGLTGVIQPSPIENQLNLHNLNIKLMFSKLLLRIFNNYEKSNKHVFHFFQKTIWEINNKKLRVRNIDINGNRPTGGSKWSQNTLAPIGCLYEKVYSSLNQKHRRRNRKRSVKLLPVCRTRWRPRGLCRGRPGAGPQLRPPRPGGRRSGRPREARRGAAGKGGPRGSWASAWRPELCARLHRWSQECTCTGTRISNLLWQRRFPGTKYCLVLDTEGGKLCWYSSFVTVSCCGKAFKIVLFWLYNFGEKRRNSQRYPVCFVSR